MEAAGNQALAEVLGGLKLKLRRVELAYEARGERSLGEHTSMIEALRARQWDWAPRCCAGTGGAVWSD